MDEIKKKYVDGIIAGGAVRDAKGKIIHEQLEEIDEKAEMLDTLVVDTVEEIPEKLRDNGTVIVLQESSENEEENTQANTNENNGLSLTYDYNPPVPKLSY